MRIRLLTADPIRRRGLSALLAESGHDIVSESPDVVLADSGAAVPPETEAPVVLLTDSMPADPPAGVLPRDAGGDWLDLTLRAVAQGLLVQAPGLRRDGGFAAAADDSPLTPRETEILTLIGHGLGNKAIARRLGISVHTVKFHLESLFASLGATNRAEAVAKGLTGGVIEL